jgi:hypothetical protein
MPFGLDKILRWVFDSRSARYRDLVTGRYVSSKQVRIWANAEIAASTDRVRTLTQLLTSDRLTVTDWERGMREELRKAYISEYLAGRGGLYRMTQADWGSIGGQLSESYRFLGNFARQIAAGNLTEGQILARVRMYINSAREAYERAHGRSAQDAGLTQVHWNLTDLGPSGAVEHCTDCEGLEAMGWCPVGPQGGFIMSSGEEIWPGTGATICLTNCMCFLDYGSGDFA